MKTMEIRPALLPLERQAADLAGAYENLADAVAACEAAKAEVEKSWLPEIRRLAGVVNRRRTQLLADIAARDDLFVEPRSVVLHGWKLGWRKQPGQVKVSDEPAAIVALRHVLKVAAENLIRVKESLDLRALREQPASVLAKAGVTLEADTDQPFLVRVGGDVEKLVAELLKRDDTRQAEQRKLN